MQAGADEAEHFAERTARRGVADDHVARRQGARLLRRPGANLRIARAAGEIFVGLGVGYLPPLYVGFKWYPEARGLVSGLAVGVFAMGAGIVGPLAGGLLGWKGLIYLIGWRHTFQVLAAAYFTLTMIGAIWLNDPPAHFVAPKPKEGGAAPKVSKVNLTTAQMMKLPSFWILWVAYVFGCFSGTMTGSLLSDPSAHNHPIRTRIENTLF